MLNPCILVSGSTIANDDDLIAGLRQHAEVLRNFDNTMIQSIIKRQKIHLVLLEVFKKTGAELDVIKDLRESVPNLAIVLIDGDREVLAEAFSFGVTDAFKKPYDSSLIVERLNALLSSFDTSR